MVKKLSKKLEKMIKKSYFYSYFYSNVGTGDIEKIFIDAIDNGEIVEAKGGGIRIFIDTGKSVEMVLDDSVQQKYNFMQERKNFMEFLT